jgi:hypothetical protein
MVNQDALTGTPHEFKRAYGEWQEFFLIATYNSHWVTGCELLSSLWLETT